MRGFLPSLQTSRIGPNEGPFMADSAPGQFRPIADLRSGPRRSRKRTFTRPKPLQSVALRRPRSVGDRQPCTSALLVPCSRGRSRVFGFSRSQARMRVRALLALLSIAGRGGQVSYRPCRTRTRPPRVTSDPGCAHSTRSFAGDEGGQRVPK